MGSSNPRRGYLITLEGGEGAGKTTQLHRLAPRLTAAGYDCITTREPGGTELGQAIRHLLLTGDPARSPWTELFLFAADRAEHVSQTIQPALAAGKIVLCDRFTDSTLAYQGYGRQLALPVLEQINQIATQGLRPDLTVWLDVPPPIGLQRVQRRASTLDTMEQSELSFHDRLYQGFQTLAAEEPHRWRRVPAQGSIEQVQESLWAVVQSFLSSRTAHES